MTLIIEIALGIVLGFWILSNLEAVLSLGIMAAIGLALLAIVGGVLIWIVSDKAVLNRVMPLLMVLAIFAVGYVVALFVSKATGLTPGESGIFLMMLFMLLSATVAFTMIIHRLASAENAPLLYLALVPFAGAWVWLWNKTARLSRERRSGAQAPPVPLPGVINHQ